MLVQSKIALVLWLVALALLPVRMASAHLHLCLDGQERPISVHVQDVPTHHGVAGAAGGHNDIDVDVSTSVSTKKASNTDELSPAILGAYVIAVVLTDYAPVAPRIEVVTAALVPVFELRPPPRGPPVQVS